ncbi:FKBP-type peptidyl-prolyl cis-trans isomerase [Odoribacter sp. OttesenSCG-928-G04]|nr:FKBP-type peptidyl-prolyl cis-trans isomerase [Odoribacter sp. OttesenSCG-928-G04]
MKTIKLFLAVSVIAFIMSSCNSGSVTSTDATLRSEKDSASFYVGYMLGSNVAGMDVNMQALVAGMNNAVQKKNLDIDMQQMQMVVMSYMQKEATKIAEINRVKGEKFLAENAEKEGIQKLECGVQYKVITEGNGPKPVETDKVRVHYIGTLIDGTEFDSSVRRGEPAEFGLTNVIPGWTNALKEMNVGSKWMIYIPSELGYGERGAGQQIGPNEVLIFEVELLDIIEKK